MFLNQSIQDAGPIMINESLSCGLPVISFKIGLAKDIVNKKNGFLAEKVDHYSLAKEILKASTISKIKLEKKKAARQTAIKYFDINKTIQFIDNKI